MLTHQMAIPMQTFFASKESLYTHINPELRLSIHSRAHRNPYRNALKTRPCFKENHDRFGKT